MDAPIIDVEGLSRSFKLFDKEKKGWFSKRKARELWAVSGLNLSLRAGEKVAFIGPNGAGKSTTLRMLCGLLRPTCGQARVCGFVPWDETKRLASKIGLVFGQRSHLWPALPVSDSFDLLSKIYDLNPRVYAAQRDNLVELFGLGRLLPQLARTLSLGERMRCDIAAALLHSPPVLFLDEPTIGLDVTAKAQLRDHLNALAKTLATTVLLTSHDTDDIEKICRRVILIDHGKKLLDTTLADMQREHTRYKTLRLATEEKDPVFVHEHVTLEERGEHRMTLKVDVTKVGMEKIVSSCLFQFKVLDIGIEDMPLDDIIRAIYAQSACAL